MSWQLHRISPSVDASRTIVGYVEMQVGVAGACTVWARAEVIEQSQPWDLLLGNTLLQALDDKPTALPMLKRRKIKSEKGSQTSLANSCVRTKDNRNNSLFLTVKKETNTGDAGVNGADTSDVKTVTKQDRKIRLEGERLGEALLKTIIESKREQAEAKHASHTPRATETISATPVVDTTRCAYQGSASPHMDAIAGKMSESETPLVDYILVTEISPVTGSIVCRQVPLISRRRQTSMSPAYKHSTAPSALY
ncbi:hypothetical protein FBU31_002837 [Coemansia sp. 'formosensis']|nr:hypothetical protein FBU31_002837 [Coemansia sp. 'formosensis']